MDPYHTTVHTAVYHEDCYCAALHLENGRFKKGDRYDYVNLRKHIDLTAWQTLATNALMLWKAAPAAGTPQMAELRREMGNPQPGDMVVDAHALSITATSGIGRLKRSIKHGRCDSEDCVIELLNGRTARWWDAEIVKVLEEAPC